LKAAWVCQGPSYNCIQRKSWRGPELRELPKIWRFFFNIYATAEARDFKFDILVRFGQVNHETTRRAKNGHDFGLRKLPKKLVFPFNISATVKTSDFKISTRLGLPRPIIKSHTEVKVDMALV